MSPNRPNDPLYDPSTPVDAVIAEVLSRQDRNETFDMEAVLQSHPDSAVEIQSFFSFGDDLMSRMRKDFEETIASDPLKNPHQTTAWPLISSEEAEEIEEVPTNIGRYEVLEKLGQGAFGTVYLAHDPLVNQKVAIKQVRAGSLKSSQMRNAYLHEANAVAQLEHPGIVRVMNVHDAKDEPLALVFQYVQGPTLSEVLREEEYSREEMVSWVAQVADALHYAHKRKIVHRDLKPANIVMRTIDGDIRPVLLDFGLATIDDRSFQDGSQQMVGTVPYMSPEQAESASEWATAQSDIFSLGVILYQILCGELPFKGTAQSEILRQVRRKVPSMPRSLDDSIPEGLEQVCIKALEKGPTDRYSTAADMARDLRSAIAPQPQPVSQPSPSRWSNSSIFAIAASIGLVVVSAALLLSKANTKQVAVRPTAPESSPLIPEVVSVDAQSVSIGIKIQRNGDPNNQFPLADGSVLGTSDKFTLWVKTTTETPGHLYSVWFSPEGPGIEIGGLHQEELRSELLYPARSNNLSGESFGTKGKAVGTHLFVAFSTSNPMTPEMWQSLSQAKWRTARNTSDEYGQLGYPVTTQLLDPSTRGGPEEGPVLSEDDYLGELKDLLEKELGAKYQALFFQVHSEGDSD